MELFQAAETTSGITVLLAHVRVLRVPGVVILRKDLLLVISSATLAEPHSNYCKGQLRSDQPWDIGIDRPGFFIGNDVLDRTI